MTSTNRLETPDPRYSTIYRLGALAGILSVLTSS
jgi:hypothetical protein